MEAIALVDGVASIDPDRCTQCGACAEACRFDAVIPGEETYRIDSQACEGCAASFYRCRVGAIHMEEQQAGLWFRSETRFGPLFHAHLFAGQENSGKLVTLVKQQARLLALDEGRDLLLVDGPPGIGYPAIASLAAADLALLVVEPTVAGVHDLERALGTAFRCAGPGVPEQSGPEPRSVPPREAFLPEGGSPLGGGNPF